MAIRVVEHAMRRKPQEHRKSAILILEEAVHLLRKAPLNLLSSYYIGALPFILGLFYFWADMSRSADAQSYQAIASLGLALLYIWMKCWHAVFAARVKMHISGQPVPRWSLQRILPLVTMQTLIHATAFIILPLAALVAIPFGWCYAFYQNITAEALTETDGLKALCKKAWFQAKLWPRQNHLLLAIFFIFSIVVLLNVASAIYILPQLLKKFIGIESMFTLSGSHVINTTFWVVTLGITYLCMNPLIKTVYVLRCFYGAAITSADDLKTELKGLIRRRSVAIIGMLLLALMAGSFTPSSATESRFTSPEALDRSIDEVMKQREFTWRLPRKSLADDEKATKGPIASVVAWIIEKLGQGIKTIIKWIDKLMDWLIDLLPTGERPAPSSDANWISSVRVALYVLLIGLLCALGYILWRSWMRRQSGQTEMAAAAVESTPNLEDDDTAADELPVNRWLEIARELTANGSWRLAMRALYLATLANLAENELITIEKFKSNQEYQNELYRRAHHKEALIHAFSKSRAVFERVWYGMHEVNRPDLDQYAAIQKRMMTIAQS